MAKRKLGRECYIKYDVCFIPLKGGCIATCDKERLQEVNEYNWSINGAGYAHTRRMGKDLYLHQLLNPSFKQTDHINHCKLDNRSCNLREADPQQNSYNTRIGKKNKTGFKGVSIYTLNGKYRASITYNGVFQSLGCYFTPFEAALAYDKKAKELFGKFAKLNFQNS